MSALELHATSVSPPPTVRALIMAHPELYRARLSLAIECAQGGGYAPNVAALALVRSLIAEEVPAMSDARIFGGQIALRLGLPQVAAALAVDASMPSRAHRDALAQIAAQAAQVVAAPPAFPAVHAITANLRAYTQEWPDLLHAGGPTTALLVATDARAYRYALDIPEAVALVNDRDGGFLCAEAHVPLEAIAEQLAPLFARGVARICAVARRHDTVPTRNGYDVAVTPFDVMGGVFTLGDAAAWQLPAGSAEAPDARVHALDLVAWTRR